MNIGDAIRQGVEEVTREYTKVKKQQIRSRESGQRALERMIRGSFRERSQKDVAFEIMEAAYMKASAGGSLPAAARQIMYQARPLILAQIDKPLGKNFDQYFTQQLLPDYMARHRLETASWDVVFDARGHLWEPHTAQEIQLGTIAVRSYLSSAGGQKEDESPDAPQISTLFPTHGPGNRYQTVLFIEKEGFMPLLQKAQIAARYDLAIMSTKGLASTAARSLVEKLKGVRFLVLHDFDKAGFSIVHTLKEDTRRYQFKVTPDVIDLGLRLTDVDAEGLESEAVYYSETAPSYNLRRNGATKEEIEFLVTEQGRGKAFGQRVELNAFSSDQLLRWLEGKLQTSGVKKIIPGDDVLVRAYRNAVYVSQLNTRIREASEAAREAATSATIPGNLRQRLERRLMRSPSMSWDAALVEVAQDDDTDALQTDEEAA